MIKNFLPSIYHHLFAGEFLELPLRESVATCNDCIKAKPGVRKSFKPNLKCCTFFPFLTNYAVGSLLENKKVREMIITGKSLPVGIVPPVSWQVSYARRAPEDFGNREDFLCPYYNKVDDNCGVWSNRGASCISYFCKSSYGMQGQDFWLRFEKMLSRVEGLLSAQVLRQKGFSEGEIFDQLGKITTKTGLGEWDYERLWKSHRGFEMNFFKEAQEIVLNFTHQDFVKIVGDSHKLIEQVHEMAKTLVHFR